MYQEFEKNVFLVLILSIIITGEEFRIQFGPCVFIYGENCDNHFVKFYLFTSHERKEYVAVTERFDNVTSSQYNPNLASKIIIHGYSSDINLSYLVDIKDEYLKSGPLNVWMIDWSPLAASPCYPAAAFNIRHVGSCLAQLVKRLGNPSNLHVIGFSLGAHVPSHAASLILPEKIPRVTGLDPSLPLLLSDTIIENRLSKRDAHFVDVIHTNAALQGDVTALGHVDFYANSGTFQPGCWNSSNWLECDHHRAPSYFSESINSKKGFWAWACVNEYKPPTVVLCAASPPYHLVGEHIDKSLTGIYVFQTASEAPFAQGKKLKLMEIPGGNDVVVRFND